MIDPTNFNVVVVAKNLNPSVFSQLWLIKNKIASEQDFSPDVDCSFTPVGVRVPTGGFELIVIPERLQITFRPEVADVKTMLSSTLGSIVKLLPHTPFEAVGFNFTYVLHANKEEELSSKLRSMFLSERNPLFAKFQSDNCRFGQYLSKDLDMGRLRLDIKPLTGLDGKSEALQAAFNINQTLQSEEKVQAILDFLNAWDTAHAAVHEMVLALAEGWSG